TPVPWNTILAAPREPDRSWRWSGALQTGARPWMGRLDREARGLTIQVGQTNARLAQAEDRPRAGVRDRRLDRTATDTSLLRRLAARRLPRSCARVRRPHRHGIQ